MLTKIILNLNSLTCNVPFGTIFIVQTIIFKRNIITVILKNNAHPDFKTFIIFNKALATFY